MKKFFLQLGLLTIIVILAALVHYLSFDAERLLHKRNLYLLQPQSDVHIGVLWPQNPDVQGYINGLNLALAELEGDKSFPYHIRPHFAKETPDKAIVWNFARNSRIAAVIGGLNTDTVKRLAPLFQATGMLFLQSSTNPLLMKRNIKLMLEVSYPDMYHAENLKEIIKSLRLNKIALLYNQQSIYCRGLKSLFLYQIKKEPEIDITSTYPFNGKFQIEKIYSDIENTDFDGIVFLGNSRKIFDFLKYARWSKNDKPFIGNEIFDTPIFYNQYDRKIMQHTYCSSYDLTFSRTPELQRFDHLYRDKYQTRPDNFAIWGYSAIMLLKKAILNSPNLLPESLYHSILYSKFSVLGLKFVYTHDGILKQNLTAGKRWLPGKGFVQFLPKKQE